MAKLRTRRMFPVISLDEKKTLAGSAEPVIISDVALVPSGEYGPWWSVVFTSQSFPECRTMAFSGSEFRDSFFADVKAQIKEEGPVEAIVVAFMNKRGQLTFTLEGEADEVENEEDHGANVIPF